MTTEELEKTVYGVKMELVDIKETLADYNDRMNELGVNIQVTHDNLENLISSSLTSYIKTDVVVNNYYDKSDIDSKLLTIKTDNFEDVKNYLSENEYLTSESLKNYGYITLNDVREPIFEVLKSYLTTEKADEKYVTKQLLNDSIPVIEPVDLSDYVDYGYLTTNYYTKNEVEKLIPSVSGFVKKSDLFELLPPFSDYAEIKWVNQNFVKKGEISFDGYVTTDMLNATNETIKTHVSEFKTELEKYDRKFEIFKSNFESKIQGIVNGYETYTQTILTDYVKNDDLSKYVTKKEFENHKLTCSTPNTDTSETTPEIDLSDYVKHSELTGYVTESYVADNIKYWANKYLGECVHTQKLVSKSYVKAYFENQKGIIEENWNDKIPNMSDYVKNSTLSDYVKWSDINERLNEIEEDIDDLNVSDNLVEQLIKNYKLVSSNELSKYATKDDVTRILGENTPSTGGNNVDLSGYVKKSDFNNLKSDVDDLVDMGTYIDKMSIIDNSLNKINEKLKTFIPRSEQSTYVDNQLSSFVSKYVTKDELKSELEKLKSDDSMFQQGGSDIMNGLYVTVGEFNNLKLKLNNYIDLEKFESLKSYVQNNFINKSINQTDNGFYTKQQSDAKYLTSLDAESKYISTYDAYSTFLTREDYRGIKDAMTLNSAYKYTESMFNTFLEQGKILDGFYVIGDRIVIIKDGEKYDIHETMTGSEYITKNEVEKDYVTKEDFEKGKGKNWIYDEGGSY